MYFNKERKIKIFKLLQIIDSVNQLERNLSIWKILQNKSFYDSGWGYLGILSSVFRDLR